MTPMASIPSLLPGKDASDEETLSTSSPTENSNSSPKNHHHSKVGRKGDPRMHRAVAARLTNPELSLIEALRIGGFNYPIDVGDDQYVLDSDSVSLGQRKNQLSRRCRLAKQQAKTGSSNKKARTKGCTTASTTCVSDRQAELDQLLFTQDPNDVSAIGRRGLKRGLPLGEDGIDGMDPQEEEALARIARQRMAKFHPQFHPILMTPSHWSMNGLKNQSISSLEDALPAPPLNDSSTLNALTAGTTQSTSTGSTSSLLQQPPPSNNHLQSHPSGVAVASLNATASSVGLTLEQLAVSLSSTTNLAKVLSEQTAPNIKHALAMNLYHAESSALYQRCMLLAGYDAKEAQETSPVYKQFAYKAWSEEGKRLEKQLDSNTTSSTSPPIELPGDSDDADGKVPAKDSFSEERRGVGGAHNAEEEGGANCLAGRHVHRLEGLCGHRPIIHQPEGAPPHVDFIVNGKVECYEGICPVGNHAAFWPSKYNCEELSCPPDSDLHKVECACEGECTFKAPKEYPLKDIDFDGKEWDLQFFENNNENSLAGLIQLGGSEDGRTT